MSDREVSRLLGLSPNYIAIQKNRKSKVLRYARLVGKGNILKGMELYDKKANNLRNKVIEISYSFKSEYAFATQLYKKGFYSSAMSANEAMRRGLYIVDSKGTHWRFFSKLNKIVKEFGKCTQN